MPRQTVLLEGQSRIVNFDDPRRRGDIFQSLVMGQLVDELTDAPIKSAFSVSCDLAGARTKAAEDGVGGAVGIPTKLLPKLKTKVYDFNIGFQSNGFLPVTASVHFGTQAGFADQFVAKDLGKVLARRSPVALRGRTVRLDVNNRPVGVSGAAVEVTGVWRLVADVDLVAGPIVSPMASLRPGLALDRPVGSSLEVVSPAAVAEPPRALAAAAMAGDVDVSVSHAVGLAAGDLIAFDQIDPDRSEFVEIKAVIGPSDPASPAHLTFTVPLRISHGFGSPADKVTVPAPGAADANTTIAAVKGDPIAFVDSTAALATGDVVRITGGGPLAEFAIVSLYRAVTDPDGFYRLPPITRVAAVEITATRVLPLPALSAVVPISLTYGLSENRLDLTMS
jgi:hypothetical protein